MEIINQSPGLAIVPVDTIVAGVDASATAARTQNAERGIGYIVGDGVNGNVQSANRSRLAGIRPKAATYNPANPYEDVL